MPTNGSPDETIPAVAGNQDRPLPEINVTVAHPARAYDYLLGGKDNFAADRALGDAVAKAMPSAREMVRANRAFLGRAVRYLVTEAGVRQVLDIGTGIPAAGNTHEVAQAAVPDSRIVYVDNDPIVLAHARALMISDPVGATAFIQADLRDPGAILDDLALCRTLDLGEPVALMLIAILMYIRDEDDPRGLVSALVDALPPGSYLTITHPTADFSPDEVAGAVTATEQGGISFTPRTQAEVAAFFDGLDLVDPGVAPILAWHPEGVPPGASHAAYYYGAMGRKS
jgi:SAM-dependent methyltransferase